MGMDIDRRQPPAEPQPSGLPVELGEQASGFAEPITPVVAGDSGLGIPMTNYTQKLSAGADPLITGIDQQNFLEQPIVESQKVEATERLGDQDIDEQKLIADQIDRSEESTPFRLSKSQFDPDYGFSRVDQITAQQNRTKDKRTLGDRIFSPSEKNLELKQILK